MLLRVLILVALMLVAAGVRAELIAIGSPEQSGALAPTWTGMSDGRVALSWLARLDEGHALRFSVFDGEGFSEVTEIARGTDWFANWADMPGLFEQANGRWLAHWLVKSGPGTYAYDIVMASSTDSGTTWSDPFSPHADGTPTEHGFVSYFPEHQEAAGVVWLDGRHTSGDEHDSHVHHGSGAMTLRVATVAAGSQVLDSQLLDDRVCDCCQTAAALTDQGPVVVYRGRSADEVRDIRIVRRREGQWTAPATLHWDGWRIEACPVNGPALIAQGRRVIAAWFTMAEGVPKVQVAASTDHGEHFTHLATLGETRALGRVDLAWWQGGFVLSWLEQVKGGATLRLAEFDSAGNLRSQRDMGRVDDRRVSGFPRLISPDGQRLLIAWTQSDPDHGSRIRVAEYRE